MPVVIIESEWRFIEQLCPRCNLQLVTDQRHWPRCPECGYKPGVTLIVPQPERDMTGTWWYEGEPFFDNEQMQSHLFHDVYGNSEIDVEMYPVLIDDHWFWEQETVITQPQFLLQ